MSDDNFIKIEFFIKLLSPALLRRDHSQRAYIPASTIKGMIRWVLTNIGDTSNFDVEELIGNDTKIGKMHVYDITHDGRTETRISTSVDRHTASIKNNSLHDEVVVPGSTLLQGLVLLSHDVTQRQITLIRSAILLLEGVGIGLKSNLGYGRCKISFDGIFNEERVFLSYAHENEEHNNWVLNLADKLTMDNIFVNFDKYDLSYGDNIPAYMEESVKSANKVLVILTPKYKVKSDKRSGGVGYEYSLIISELSGFLSENKKYLPVLRKGDFEISIPPILSQYFVCDMRDDEYFERKYVELHSSIVGKAIVSRPSLSRVTKPFSGR